MFSSSHILDEEGELAQALVLGIAIAIDVVPLVVS